MDGPMGAVEQKERLGSLVPSAQQRVVVQRAFEPAGRGVVQLNHWPGGDGQDLAFGRKANRAGMDLVRPSPIEDRLSLFGRKQVKADGLPAGAGIAEYHLGRFVHGRHGSAVRRERHSQYARLLGVTGGEQLAGREPGNS